MEHYDVVILGAGIAGLNAAFLAKRKGLKSLTIESLSEPGGQLTTLYAEKNIYNFPSHMELTAFNLTQKIISQVQEIGAEIKYNEKADKIEKIDEGFLIQTNRGEYKTKKIVLALGKGSFSPRLIGLENEDKISSILYTHTKLVNEKNKTIAILGGGDSALDWANHFSKNNKIIIIHRRNKFRAEEAAVQEAQKNANIQFKINYQINSIVEQDNKTQITVIENNTQVEEKLEADYVFVNYGFTSKLELLKNSLNDLEMQRQKVVVNNYMQTNILDLYAIGDLAYYSARVDNILCAMNDANICINHIAKEMLKKSGIY